jgi:hypothetical protein
MNPARLCNCTDGRQNIVQPDLIVSGVGDQALSRHKAG